jgi:hypothetical protein
MIGIQNNYFVTHGFLSTAEIQLMNWYIKPVEKAQSVQVEGYKPDSNLDEEPIIWHSSTVAERVDKTRVKTKGGSIYRLM